MKATVLALVIICSTIAVADDKWKSAWSLSCAQIKLDGKNVSGRPFVIYRATGPDEACCKESQRVLQGKTRRFGYFQVRKKLDLGYYYAVFESKTMKVVVPIELKNNYIAEDCSQPDTIIRARSNGDAEIDTIVTVD